MGGEHVRYGSYEELYAGEYDNIAAYIRRTVYRDDMAVEDLTQDVMLVAYMKWETVAAHPNPPGYLKTIARHYLLKWFEKQGKIWLCEESLLEEGIFANTFDKGQNPYKMAEFYYDAENVLSGVELQMLRDYYEFGYTASELAEKYGVTQSCFKVRIARMKKKLINGMGMLAWLAVGVFIHIVV